MKFEVLPRVKMSLGPLAPPSFLVPPEVAVDMGGRVIVSIPGKSNLSDVFANAITDNRVRRLLRDVDVSQQMS